MKDTRRRNVVLPSKGNSVISWKEVTNCLTYFAMIKENLNWSINYACQALTFNFMKTKKEGE